MIRHPRLLALHNKLKNIPIEGLLEEAAAITRQAAVELQKEQLYEGKTNEDKPIEPDYTDYTKVLKSNKGQPYDRVTLKDTGKFYANIFAEVEDLGILFVSDDAKTPALVEKYKGIFGLGPQKKDIYVKQHLKPVLQQQVWEWWKSH